MVHSSTLFSYREKMSSAGSIFKFRQRSEIHTGALFLKRHSGKDMKFQYSMYGSLTRRYAAKLFAAAGMPD